ncbi:hypothetical protein QBC40DRAFT_293978 [Triangularia verruculosa]|uniref:Uncharacterized protein n=1 Tax=Triangularia verruculosa TaxID=2587418 RepID=A0AAN6XM40_9PEZI|nr:hypothetical protein QBC40DRAFT_293978 [Triangularia verruculosa]
MRPNPKESTSNTAEETLLPESPDDVSQLTQPDPSHPTPPTLTILKDDLEPDFTKHLRHDPHKAEDLDCFNTEWFTTRTLLRGYVSSSLKERSESRSLVVEGVNRALKEILAKLRCHPDALSPSYELRFAAIDTVRKILRCIVSTLGSLAEQIEHRAPVVMEYVMLHFQDHDIKRLMYENGGAWIEEFWAFRVEHGSFCQVDRTWEYIAARRQYCVKVSREAKLLQKLQAEGAPSIEYFRMGRKGPEESK